MKSAISRAAGMFWLLAGVLLLSAARSAEAQRTRSWAAPVDGAWNDPSKWSPVGVPGANDLVEIAVAGSPYTVSLQGAVSIAKLTVGNAATLVVNGNPTKGNALLRVANGITNAGALRLESSGGAQTANILLTSGTLVNTGSLEANPGSGGQRLITADLTNQGRVQINAPTTFSKSRGTYTNSGDLNIAASQKLSIAGGYQVFNQNGGTLRADGDFALSSATFNFNGGNLEGSGAVLTAAGLNIGPDAGTGSLVLRGACVLGGNVKAGQVLWVNGTTTGGGLLRAASGFTNAGTIRLESSGASVPSNIALGSGVLANAGLLEVNPGSGGQRLISANLDNQGEIHISAPTAFSKASGTYANSGRLVVAAGQSLTISGGSQTFTQGSGSLVVEGSLLLSGMTLAVSGGEVRNEGRVELSRMGVNFTGGAWSGNAPVLTGATLSLGASSGAGVFVLRGACGLTGDLREGQVLWVNGNLVGGNAQLRAAGGFTNGGVIRLESSEGAWASNLVVAAGRLINSGTGRLEVNAGTGGQRSVSADLDNQGQVQINAPAVFSKAGGTYANNGEFAIAPGQTLSIAGNGQAFNQNGGTLRADGDFALRSATFNFNGGAIEGNGLVPTASTLNIGPAAGRATFLLRGSCLLNGNVNQGQTLWVNGNPAGGNASLRAPAGFTNSGTIRLESSGGIFSSNLTLPSGTLVNQGTIEINAGTGGQRQLSADLDNQGELRIGAPAALPKATGVYANTGTLSITAGQGLTISGGSQVFNQNGGTLAIGGSLVFQGSTANLIASSFNFNGGEVSGGEVIVQSAVLSIAPGATGAASFRTQGRCTLKGNVAADQRLWVNGRKAMGVLTWTEGLVNEGVIRLESSESPDASLLTVPNGTLVNRGRIEVRGGSGGARTIATNLDNRGVLAVGCPFVGLTYYSKTYDGQFPNEDRGFYVNTGVFDISPGSKLDIRGGTFSLRDPGVISGGGELVLFRLTVYGTGTITANVTTHNTLLNPGMSGAGILRIEGNYFQGPASELQIQVGGLVPGAEHDQLQVSGNAVLSGGLKVSQIDGYAPTPCDALTVLTYGSRSGQFSPVEGLNLGGDLVLRTNFGAAGLDLLARAPSAKVNFIPHELRVAESGGNRAYQVCLSEQPTAAVGVEGIPDAQVTISPPELTFAAAAWGAVQSFSVAAVDDPVTEGLHRGTVAHAVHSADPRFNGAAVGNVGVQIEDNDALPAVSIADVSVSEGGIGEKAATFAVTLSNPSSQTVTVSYATANGTATAGSDYAAASGTLIFSAGETSKTIGITIDGDLANEGDETFLVNLTSADKAILGDAQGVGTILTDDHAPEVSQAAPSAALLWPPDHKMVDIQITGLTDADRDPLTVVITGITQDEAVYGSGKGEAGPDGAGIGTAVAQVRAEREGGGNGRVYEISFTASDGHEGGLVAGRVKVCVPHDQGDEESECVDDGQQYNSITGSLEGAAAKVAAALSGGKGFGVGNYPNPFNPATTVVYTLSEEAPVRLAIYNMLGQQVRILVEGVQGSGNYGMEWDGTDKRGHQVSAGLYFYQLEAGPRVATGKMLLVR